MKIGSWYVVFVLLLHSLAGCAGEHSQIPSDYSDSLIVLPDASDIHYVKLRDTDQIIYYLKANYPATEVINEVSRELKHKGWVPLQEDFFNPGLPTSHVRGWTTYIDGTKNPERKVHTWASDWRNEKGDILLYAFTYSYPVETKADLSSLRVLGIYMPASVAQAGLEAIESFKQQQKESDK